MISAADAPPWHIIYSYNISPRPARQAADFLGMLIPDRLRRGAVEAGQADIKAAKDKWPWISTYFAELGLNP